MRKFPELMARQAETYAKKLVGKQETLGDLQKDLSVLIRKSHIVDVLSQHKPNMKLIEEAEAEETGSCNILRPMAAKPTGQFLKQVTSSVKYHSNVTFIY